MLNYLRGVYEELLADAGRVWDVQRGCSACLQASALFPGPHSLLWWAWRVAREGGASSQDPSRRPAPSHVPCTGVTWSRYSEVHLQALAAGEERRAAWVHAWSEVGRAPESGSSHSKSCAQSDKGINGGVEDRWHLFSLKCGEKG